MMGTITRAKPDIDIQSDKNYIKIALLIVTNSKFDMFIMGVIVLNMIQMGLFHEGQSKIFASALEKINYAFTATFVIEATIKLVAMRRDYFKNPWNDFDFFVVISSLADILLSSL